MKRKSFFVISLDFELCWGLIEKENLKGYARSNVQNVAIVIDKILELFNKYGVKSTFATVGLLMCSDKEEAVRYFPAMKPTYENSALSPYGVFFDHINPSENNLFFASSLVERLKTYKSVEIATHTFCHYYCWEKGQTLKQFEDDIRSAKKLATSKGINLTSIIFPRNNVSDDYLRVCWENGIVSYRGNARRFFSKPNGKLDLYRNRILRLIDAYLPFGEMNTYSKDDLLHRDGLPFNIPASRFFRPYSKTLSFIEPLKIKRIKSEIRYAAKNGELYHLWWHPHNFGSNLSENLKNLEDVLKEFSSCKERYGMESYTMSELTNLFNNNE